MKAALILTLLTLPMFAHAAPSGRALDPASTNDAPLMMATRVSEVRNLGEKKTASSITIRVLDAGEGNMNATDLLVSITTGEGGLGTFLINSELSAIGQTTVKWVNAGEHNSGLYLTVQGVSTAFTPGGGGHAQQHEISIKLTDATGVVLDAPSVNQIN